MEPVGVPAPRHQAAGELVDDQDLSVLDDVLDVLLEERVGLQQLRDVVDSLAPLPVNALQLSLLGNLVRGGQSLALVDLPQLHGQVGQEEQIGIALGEELAALLREVDRVALLVDGVEEVLVHLAQPLVADEVELDPLDQPLQPRLVGQELVQALVLGRAAPRLEQLDARLVLLLRVLEEGLRLREDPVGELGLAPHDALHVGLQLVVLLKAVLHRPRDDERRARLVDEDRVDLVDDRVMMSALDPVVPVARHVVAQVVEAELVVGAVGDVAGVGGAALREVHGVLDAADRQTEGREDLPHPLAVALREVVVHRDQVDAAPGQRVQVDGQRRDEGLALAGRHLRDLALVEDDRPRKLHVEGDHVPGDREPANVPRLAAETPADLLDHGERFGDEGVELLSFREARPELGGLPRQRFVGETLEPLELGVDLVDERPHPLDVALVFASDKSGDQVDYHATFGCGRPAERVSRGAGHGPKLPPACPIQRNPRGSLPPGSGTGDKQCNPLRISVLGIFLFGFVGSDFGRSLGADSKGCQA